MTPIIFDGREFARQKEKLLKGKVSQLKRQGMTPKLGSILVGDNPSSKLYTSLKKKAAERIGAVLEIKEFPVSVSVDQLNQLIRKLNKDESVHGIMLQLPLPPPISNHQSQIINSISPEKDVDGLREDSQFRPATVKAILEIIDYALKFVRRPLREAPLKVTVVGSSGMVGTRLVKELRILNYEVGEADIETKDLKSKTQDADVLISATGVPDLIKSDMVKIGAIVIDVGSPEGDVDFPKVCKKAAFITPVPGGVGPVTISCLLGNLVEAAVV